MTNNQAIKILKNESVLEIHLNRPESYNSINEPMARELLQAVIEASTDSQVRAVLITGTGDAFCAGGDISEFFKAGDGVTAFLEQVTASLHAAVSRILRMQKPVITVINGPAAGAGFSLAMAGDLVIASSKAKFTSAYSRLGTSPDGGLTFFLTRLLGVRRALELVLTDRTLSAGEAVEWGLVTREVPAESCMEEARTLAKRMAEGATLAYGRSKELIYHGVDQGLEAQMERETRRLCASSQTRDFRDAVQAFVEKRKPAYAGK